MVKITDRQSEDAVKSDHKNINNVATINLKEENTNKIENKNTKTIIKNKIKNSNNDISDINNENFTKKTVKDFIEFLASKCPFFGQKFDTTFFLKFLTSFDFVEFFLFFLN